jgi:peptide-methionine (R)-S-oxide reductase
MTVSRRQAVTVLAAAGALGPLSLWMASTGVAPESANSVFPLQKSDDEWRAVLSNDRYRILRGHGTERAFSSVLSAEKRSGIFVCAGCGRQLFSSDTKFESGTGWPSFWIPIEGAVGTSIDRSWLMVRTEVHCAHCGGHLGHVFDDGPRPTGLRYCINGLALNFVMGSGVI